MFMDKKHMKKLLKDGWGIKNKEDLESTITWLFNEGHNSECMDRMEIYNQDSTSDHIQ